MNFNESQTKTSLARAFAGVSQDNARYQFIAKEAEGEGYFYISYLLKELASKKLAHASLLYRKMLEKSEMAKERVNIEAGYPFEEEMLNTSLRASSEIENYEGKNVFAHFAKIAKDEGYDDVAQVFDRICKVCIKNGQLLQDLADKFDSGKLYKSSEENEWMCFNCGNFEKKREAWETCPLCGYPQGYIKIEIK